MQLLTVVLLGMLTGVCMRSGSSPSSAFSRQARITVGVSPWPS